MKPLLLLPLFLLPLTCFAQPVTSVAQLLRAPVKGQSAVLEGNLIGKKNFVTYRFRDASGELLVDVGEIQLSRDMRRGALMRIEGSLSKPFGSRQWELSLEDAALVTHRSTVSPLPVSPRGEPIAASPRKPFRLPFQRATAEPTVGKAPMVGVVRTSRIADVLKAPGRSAVSVSGTILEVVSTRKILLWDGQAAIAVRLDEIAIVPELARAQRVQVTGVPVREGEALVELQASSVR